MALRGAVPVGTPDPAGTRLQRSRTQPWKTVDLAWGGARHRSLLLYALFISGVFAGFALPSMVTQPPDLLTLLSLRYLSCVLFAVGIVVAPTTGRHRLYALFALTVFTLLVMPRSLIAGEELPFQITYGLQDCLRFISVGALVMFWFAIRMRHPLSCAAAGVLYAIVGGLFFLFGSDLIRELAVPPGFTEPEVSWDEAYIWSFTLVLTVPILFFCSWIDSYVRNAVPLYGNDYRARMHVVDPKTEIRFRQAWVAFWLLLDVWAIERICRVLRAPATLKGDREWYARLLLALSTGRLTTVVFGAVAVAMHLINQEYRPF